MILGLIPVLAEEVRGAPYSSCWSSQVVLMEVKELPQILDFIERYDRLMVRNWNAGELSSCSALPKSVKALSSYRPPHVQVCRFRIRSIRKKKGSLFELAEIEIIDKLEKHRLPYPVEHHIYFAPPHEDAQNRVALTGQNRHRTQQTNAYFWRTTQITSFYVNAPQILAHASSHRKNCHIHPW